MHSLAAHLLQVTGSVVAIQNARQHANLSLVSEDTSVQCIHQAMSLQDSGKK